jgi:hypothetical protein
MRRRSCPSPCLAPRACGLPWQFPPPSKVIARTGRQAVCRRFRRRCLARADTASLYGAHIRPALRVRRRKTQNVVTAAVREETRGPHQPSVALRTMTGGRLRYTSRGSTQCRESLPCAHSPGNPSRLVEPSSDGAWRQRWLCGRWPFLCMVQRPPSWWRVGGGDTWHTVGAGIEREGGRTPLVRGWSRWCLGRG